jgi:hypothetical protein
MKGTLTALLCVFTMATMSAQNVGIGVTNPQFSLDINGRTRIRSGGDAFSSAGLWLNNINNTSTPVFVGMMNNNQVGIFGAGLTNWGFNMNTDNGFVGIGVGVFTPEYRLDVAGRMRIRSGGDANTSAGLWLNNSANSTTSAFMGMVNDNTVGFYGRGINRFGLTMNTDNGDVNIPDNIDVAGNANVAGNINGRNIGATGSISTLGNIVASNISTRANISATGNLIVAGQVSMGLVYKFNYNTLAGLAPLTDITCGCPANTKAIGGGGGARDPSGAGDVVVSFTGLTDDQNGWRIMVSNNNPFSSRLVICWVVCARMQN